MALVALVRAPGEVSRRAQALLDLLALFTTVRATSSALTAAGHRVASGVDKPADQAANPQFSTGVRQVDNLTFTPLKYQRIVLLSSDNK